MASKVVIPDYQLPGKPETSMGVRIVRTVGLILIILFVLGWLSMPKYGRGAKPKVSATKATISNVKAALNEFEITFGRYPTTEEGLEALVEKPASLSMWSRPFVLKLPLDGWGQALIYRSPSDSDFNYDLHSVGPDGVDGTTDDISKNDI